MSAVKSREELQLLKVEALERRKAQATTIRAKVTVGIGTCGIAAGARDTMKSILKFIEEEQANDIVVAQTGCNGQCEWEPIIEVQIGSEPKVMYGMVCADRAKEIMREHVMGSKIIPEYVIRA